MKFLLAALTVSVLYVSCGSKDSGGHNDDPAPVPQGETNLVENKGLLGRWGTLVYPLIEKESGAETGEWKLSIIIKEGFFTFHSETVNYGVKCAELDLTVAANLKDDSIELLEGKSIKKDFENSGIKCSSSLEVKKGTAKYTLEGDSLTIEDRSSSSEWNFNRL